MQAKTFVIAEMVFFVISLIGGGWWWSILIFGTLSLIAIAYEDMKVGIDREIVTCPKCGVVGSFNYKTGTRTTRTEGIVTRRTTKRTHDLRYYEPSPSEYSVEKREERVPVIKTTTVTWKECSACGYRESERVIGERQEEDFERPLYPPVTNSLEVIERERIRIPCRYCGVYVDPIANRTCPNCGSVLK